MQFDERLTAQIQRTFLQFDDGETSPVRRRTMSLVPGLGSFDEKETISFSSSIARSSATTATEETRPDDLPSVSMPVPLCPAPAEVVAILPEFSQQIVPYQREMTLMIRNIPNRYTQRMLLAEIRRAGFDRSFDFIYMPMDVRTRNNFGYCFLNFIDFHYARQFVQQFEGKKLSAFKSLKSLAIQPANTQGLYGNMTSFQPRDKDVPPEYQPIVFDSKSGLEIIRELPVPSLVDGRGLL